MTRHIVDMTDGFKGWIQTATYLADDGSERVMYSSGETLAEYLAANAGKKLEVYSSTEMAEIFKKHYASLITEAVQIDEEAYWDALEVLPPENFCSDQFEHFRMCEYYTGTITNQYASRGGVYLQKVIDATDKSTWITMADFYGLKPEPNSEEG